jgi:hypothetical protein
MANFIASWGPMILLIVVWIVAMKKFRSNQNIQLEYLKQYSESHKKIEIYIERIAIALESKNK